MKKLIYLLTLSLIMVLEPSQALAQNSSTYSIQMKRCMTPTIIKGNTVSLTANQIPSGEMVYVVDCTPTSRDFICTTGNKEADKLLKMTPLQTASTFSTTSNPINQKTGNTIKTEAYVDFSNNKTHVFLAVVLMNANSNTGSQKALSFSNLNFFDQNLTECKTLRASSGIVSSANTYGAMRNANQTMIVGQAAPLSTVDVMQNDKSLIQAIANTYGEYTALIDNRKIEQTEQMNVVISPALKSGVENKFMAFAQNTKKATFMIDPIFSNLEGYAYDSLGKAIPNAVVNIKLKNSSDIYYSTTADNAGFFKIMSEFLPIYAYEVEIKNSLTSKTTKISTTEFAKSNLQYLLDKKINLVVYAKGTSDTAAETKINAEAQKQVTKTLNSPLTEPSSIMFTLLTLFVIICVIGITLFFLYKNNLHEDNK